MEIANIEPTTAAVRFLAKAGINGYKRRRRNAILSAIENGKLTIDSHQLQSDEFISAYLATEHALTKVDLTRFSRQIIMSKTKWEKQNERRQIQ